MLLRNENFYHIEYLGEKGITQRCLVSLGNLIQTNPNLTYALLLTNNQSHALIIKDIFESYFVIRSGFASGYSGEGAKGLATALSLLEKHQIETEEILVSSKILNKLNHSSLSDVNIDSLFSQEIIRPIRLHDYIYPFRTEVSEVYNPKRCYPLELPYSIIDDRIFDLALLFKQDPDSALLKAYKRLEDIVRTRTGINVNSSRLFSQALLPPKGCLTWDLPDNSEIDGRANLFINTYKAFRNARAHREKDENFIHQYREFLLINELYLLESEAIPLKTEQ